MNAYQNDLLESVEYLRAHARVSYARALELLQAHDGDVAACLIELEREGCVNPPSDAPGAAAQADAAQADAAQADAHAAQDARSAVSNAMRRARHAACSALSTLLRLRVNVSQAGAQVTDLSALFVLALAILCPPLLLLAALALLLLGYRFSMSAVQAQDVMLGELVRGTGRSLCVLGRSAAQTVRDLFRQTQAARG